MDREEIFYLLNVEDIQTVALQEYERELDKAEVKKVIAVVENSINWFEIIDYAIVSELGLERADEEYDDDEEEEVDEEIDEDKDEKVDEDEENDEELK